ncbi:MAG: SDR family NAD(P)-dependent oxidoreductase [Bacteroidota bacterium]
MRNIDNKINQQRKAIIIGATSGIGKCLVPLLINSGYKVGITGRRSEKLMEMQSEFGDHVVILCSDISELSIVVRDIEQLVETLDGLDLLVISAGTGDLNSALEFEPEKRTIDTNIAGFTLLADWAFNYFKNKKTGHLAAITSIAGLRGSRFAPAYNASKAYEVNYLEGLRQKAKHEKLNISITDIRPGFVKTAMAKGDGQFWVASPEKAAKQILRGIKRKCTVVYVTKRWRLIAILFKMMPRWLMDRI